MERKV
jgi:hypothetical protein